MKEDKNILISSKKITRKKKNIILLKNKTKFQKRFKKKKILNINMKRMLIPLFIIIIIILIIILIFILYLLKPKRKIKIKKQLKLENISNTFNNSLKYEEFDENINEQYIQLQNYFCEKQNESIVQEYEKRIIKADAIYNGKKFEMFVYKRRDAVSISIINTHKWEENHTLNVLKALEYYSKKKNIENKDIYLLDIGSNIGWYSYYLGKYGYKILSFEANQLNNYILYKNFCINKDVNVTLINKGLDVEDKICTLKTVRHSRGNGMIFCENREKSLGDFRGDKFDNIELTKLSRYYKYLSDKNLALIKIDVEGSEAYVLEGGKELINKYHVPFIMMEYELKMVKAHRINALEFFQFFENNGYKIALNDFFSKNYTTSSKLAIYKDSIELFIVYEKFLE